MMNGTSALAALSTACADIVAAAAPSVVAVEGRGRVGSTGFFLRPDLVVTADHALESDEVEVVFEDGATETVTIVGRDPSTDVAVLRTQRQGTVVATDGESRVGSLAFAVARDDDGDIAATWGLIGTNGAAWRTWHGGSIERFLRPDLDVGPRFSGSPLIDAQGRLIGMNTTGLSRRQTLTVPQTTLERVLDALATRGRIVRGYLGVALQQVALPAQLGDGSGSIVVGVEDGSPAEGAGMIVGDVIVGVAGAREDIDGIHAAIANTLVGNALALDVLRGGTPQHVHVHVGERPAREE